MGSRPPTDPTPTPGRGAATLAALALGCVVAAGCSGDRGGDEVGAVDSASPPPATATPARYRTDLAAVPFSDPEASVYLRFRQDVTGNTLRRRYAAWRLDAPEGSRVLTIRDSLPAPRAAWRILPGPGLRVVAGEGEEPASLLFGGDEGAWEIALDSLLASWPGTTGQRESVALGRLSADSIRPALLVLRRAARPLDSPPLRDRTHLFVLVDEEGRGLVVQARRPEPTGAGPEEPTDLEGIDASVRIREATRVRPLEGARLVPDDTAASPTSWTLRDPDGGEMGRLEVDPARLEVHEAGDERADPDRPAGPGGTDGSPTVTLGPASGSLEALGGGALRGLHVVVRGG